MNDDLIAELVGDLTESANHTPRSLQTEAGASQTYGCRAELVMLGNGVPESDPRLGWEAWVGNAIHERLAVHAQRDGRIIEQRFTYRGVPCTIDRYDAPHRRVIDYKTKADAGAIAAVRRDGPPAYSVAQVMLGAAAVVEAGFEVETVHLVYLPRVGDVRADSWVFSAPFDRAVADEAAEWHEKLRAIRAEREGLPVAEMVDGLRDKPPSWCWQWCTRATACRGPRPASPPVDEGVADVAAEYREARALKAEAESRLKAAQAFLTGYDDLRSVGLQWVGGNVKVEEVLDLERLVEEYRFVVGEPPTRTVEKTTARSLRQVK